MKYCLNITIFILCQLVYANQQSSFLSVTSGIRDETVISLDSQTHIDYGLSYPITYEMNIQFESFSLRSYQKFQANQEWTLMEEKTENDFLMELMLSGLIISKASHTYLLDFLMIQIQYLSKSQMIIMILLTHIILA